MDHFASFPMKEIPFLVATVLLLLGGCGGNDNLARVTGKVTLDGEPVVGALVVFSPVAGGTTSYGRTTASGEYEMMFSDNERGAWLGENAVRITTADVGTGDTPASKERIPSVYNSETKLKAVVESKANVFDFSLQTSAGKVKQTIRE